MKRTIYATPQDAEAAFYESIERSDLETMMTVWADDDDIVCVHPGAARASGVAQVRESWRQIFAGGQALRFRLRHPQTVNGMTLVCTVFTSRLRSPVKRARTARSSPPTSICAPKTAGAWSCTMRPPRPPVPMPRASARQRRCIEPLPAV